MISDSSHNYDLYERLVNEMVMGICLLQGPDFRITLTNPAFEEMAGAPDRDLKGRLLAEAAPDLHAALLPMIEDTLRTGISRRSSGLPLRVESGGEGDIERYFSCETSPMELDGGAVMVIMAEMSEQVLARRADEEAKAYQELVLESVHEAILAADRGGTITLWNRAAGDLFGWSAAEMIGRNATTLITTPELKERAAGVLAILEAGATYQGEMNLMHRSGRPLLADVNVAALRGSEGQIKGYVCSVKDITEQRRIACDLHASEQRLQAVLDYMPVGVWLMNKQGRIDLANPAGQRIWEGARYLDLDHVGEFRARWLLTGKELTHDDWAGYRAVTKGETSLNELLEIDCFDGSRKIVRNSAVPFYDNDELLGVVVVNEDITELYQIQASLTRYARNLERSNRDLQDFAFVASHDLQEPLRKVKSFGDLLMRRYEGQIDAEGLMYIERMQQAALRMQDMIDDILAFSRISENTQPFARVALKEAAQEAASNLEQLLDQTGGKVEIGPLPAVMADRRQIVQLFQNLIANAIKFHRKGVPPLVQVEEHARSDNLVEIAVRDNGVGFDLKQFERIFQPFQRLHGRSEFEGNGIGLAICRRIMEYHGGKITASSTPGSGSTFVISLPVQQAQPETTERSAYER